MRIDNKHIDDMPDFASWKHLLFVAERISDLPEQELMSGMQELMDSLDEYFPRTLSPLKDFRSYANRQFCKSISDALYRIENSQIKNTLRV